MIVLIMFIMRIPLKDMLVMIIPIVFVLLTLSPWFPPIFCSHRGATVEVLLFKTEEKVAPTYTVNGLIGIPSLSITITFKPMKNHLSPYFTVYLHAESRQKRPFFGPWVVVFLLALHHHRCLHRHCLRLLQRLGPAGESEEHQVDDGPPKGGGPDHGLNHWLHMV